MPGVTMPLKIFGPMPLLSFLHRSAVYGTDRTRPVGEVAQAAGGAAGLLVVQAYDSYEFERMRVAAAADSDFVFVNLFRAPVGAPLRPDAVGSCPARPERACMALMISIDDRHAVSEIE
jgi:hypothetical protein